MKLISFTTLWDLLVTLPSTEKPSHRVAELVKTIWGMVQDVCGPVNENLSYAVSPKRLSSGKAGKSKLDSSFS